MGLKREEPIPLPRFIEYGKWFQQNAVPDVDPTFVQHLSHDGKQFQLVLADGRTTQAESVTVATGVATFYYTPDFAQDLPIELASHTQLHTDFSRFRDQEVVVIGSGQSGLETAALLHEAGARVELIARSTVIWINRKLYDYTGPVRHVFYPPSDVGPPGLNWLVAFPLAFSRFPEDARQNLDKRAVRPAGAQWLRRRVEGQVKITERTEIVKATPHNTRLHLELSNGTTREIDHLFMGTGYRSTIHKLDFLDPALREKIQERNGYPVLNKWFESSVPQLYFAGALANHTFGPICRFVAGSKIPAQQISQHAKKVA